MDVFVSGCCEGGGRDMQLWVVLMRGNGVGLVNFRVEPCSRRPRGRVLGSCNNDSDAEFGAPRNPF